MKTIIYIENEKIETSFIGNERSKKVEIEIPEKLNPTRDIWGEIIIKPENEIWEYSLDEVLKIKENKIVLETEKEKIELAKI